MEIVPGPLALVGGDEFHPGNEPQDELLAHAAGGRPAYIIATAARDHPEAAVATARRWFSRFGIDVEELRVRTRTEAQSHESAAIAAEAGLIYIAGGDPGRVVEVLRQSRVWAAVEDAWRRGCALAGSSAGAMALCQWSLIRAQWPDRTDRRPREALGIVPGCAVLPHFETFGERWIPSAQRELGAETLLIGVDERSAALWTDASWRAVGPGRVTLVQGEQRTAYTSATGDVPLPQPRDGRGSSAT